MDGGFRCLCISGYVGQLCEVIFRNKFSSPPMRFTRFLTFEKIGLDENSANSSRMGAGWSDDGNFNKQTSEKEFHFKCLHLH